MDKKGQVTLFIVLVMVIFSILILVYSLENGAIDRIKQSGILRAVIVSGDEADIKQSVESCMKSVGSDGLLLVGLQGGKIFPDKYYLYEGIKVSYASYEGKNVLASRNEAERDLEYYYVHFLPNCIASLNRHDINKGNLTVNVEIKNDSVNVALNYPMNIIQNEQTTRIKYDYNAIFNVRLGKMLDAANRLAAKTSKRENNIDIDYILKIGDDFYVNMAKKDNIVLYVLVDRERKLNNANYTFMFAEKFKKVP